jgi:hypothetical protein
VKFDENMNAFFVLTANSQDFTMLINENNRIVKKETAKLTFLENSYTRSFIVTANEFIFVSGPAQIVIAEKLFPPVVKQVYKVDEKLTSMNDILYVNGYYYISVSSQKLFRTNDLAKLYDINLVDDIYQEVDFKGTPYYFSKIDSDIFIPEITEYSRIRKFSINVNNGDLVEKEIINDSGVPDQKSIDRKKLHPAANL